MEEDMSLEIKQFPHHPLHKNYMIEIANQEKQKWKDTS